ncbi:uncharacterized protein Z519_07257 [Cladophialophora bantiana CBS 173.52]|uniref:Uncharacterized protein n=1 Tax=Cladophialophora bantiana (strain ATCC 10958 / CBS 173.52 / CDC B-1940 / NIH 8579) TaxID=1442370 RepID=A0A0D2HG69_CLAB1|nr:uncharacterized protein Z519_07257 [Cladophialophora bantiana CBS 173.52]KIW92273.1 hypothetical protein Z519_07257 [Cladophialophora bantiana CBS 173.52]
MTVENELLVHVNAASTARDDRRYIAIAQSILDFRPAIITRVSGPGPHPPSSASREELGGADEHEVVVDTRLVSNVRRLVQGESDWIAPAA